MKPIITFFAIFALNLNLFAATTTDEITTLETLGEHNLHLAYQDFLDYRAAHPEAYDLTLQSPIAFAYELGHERFEHQLAFKMLNNDEVDPSTFTEADQKALHGILVWAPVAQVASAHEANLKPWLISAIYEIFPNEAGLFDIAKRADSKDAEVRRQAATELFEMMTTSLDLKTKRNAAKIATDIRENNGKGFLDNEQLESIREALTAAINDESLSIEQRLFFASSLIWASNASSDGGKLGTEEQRRVILDTLFSFAGHEDLPLHQRLTAAELVIEACTFHNPHVYTAPEEQRLAALAFIENLMDHHPQIHKAPPLLWIARKSYNADNPSAADESLLTTVQSQKLEAHFQHILHTGRAYEKVRILNQVAYNKIALEVKRTAVEQSLALSSQFLTPFENHFSYGSIIGGYDSANNHSPVASDEEKLLAMQRLRPLMKSLDLCIHRRANIVSNTLTQRDSHTNHLASPEAIIEAIEYGLTLLDPSEHDEYGRFWLSKTLFDVGNYTFTAKQFNILFPNLLFGLSQEGDDDQKENSAKKLLSSAHITTEQCQQVLQVFINEMNDSGKLTSTRKKRAEFVKSSTHATAEQQEEADAILGKKRTPKVENNILTGTDTALLLHAMLTGNTQPYANFCKTRAKQKMSEFLDQHFPGNDQMILINPETNSPFLAGKTKGDFKTAQSTQIDTVTFSITLPTNFRLRNFIRAHNKMESELWDSVISLISAFEPADTNILDQSALSEVDTQEDISTRDGFITTLLVSANEGSVENTVADIIPTIHQDALAGTDTEVLLKAVQDGNIQPYISLCKEQVKSRVNQFLDSIAPGNDQTELISSSAYHCLLPNRTKSAFKTILGETIDTTDFPVIMPINCQMRSLENVYTRITESLYNSIERFMKYFPSYCDIFNPNVITQSALSLDDDIRTHDGFMFALTHFCEQMADNEV